MRSIPFPKEPLRGGERPDRTLNTNNIFYKVNYLPIPFARDSTSLYSTPSGVSKRSSESDASVSKFTAVIFIPGFFISKSVYQLKFIVHILCLKHNSYVL